MTKYFSLMAFSAPFLSIFVLLLADLFLLSGSVPMPFLGLIALIYWGIYRPDLTQIYLMMIFGLLVDVIQGHDAWIHMFMFLVINLIATSQFRFFKNKPFFLIWAGVSVIILLYYLMLTIYILCFLGSGMQLLPTFSAFLLTVAFVPIVFKSMIYLHGMLHEGI